MGSSASSIKKGYVNMDKLEGEGNLEVIKGCRIIKYTPNGFVC